MSVKKQLRHFLHFFFLGTSHEPLKQRSNKNTSHSFLENFLLLFSFFQLPTLLLMHIILLNILFITVKNNAQVNMTSRACAKGDKKLKTRSHPV